MIESLRSNALYEESEKFIFIDGPRNDEDRRKIQEVTKNDIIKVAKKVKMDTVFFLEGVAHEEN